MENGSVARRPRAMAKKIARRIACWVLLALLALVPVQAVCFELWYDAPIDREFYGQVHGPCDLYFDGLCAYLGLGFVWPHSPERLAKAEQQRCGDAVRLQRVCKRTRFCTEAEVCYTSGERALLVSKVVRDYNDNGDWVGFRVHDSYAELPLQ